MLNQKTIEKEIKDAQEDQGSDLNGDEMLLSNFLLKDVEETNQKLARFDYQPYKRACLGLAELDIQIDSRFQQKRGYIIN